MRLGLGAPTTRHYGSGCLIWWESKKDGRQRIKMGAEKTPDQGQERRRPKDGGDVPQICLKSQQFLFKKLGRHKALALVDRWDPWKEWKGYQFLKKVSLTTPPLLIYPC